VRRVYTFPFPWESHATHRTSGKSHELLTSNADPLFVAYLGICCRTCWTSAWCSILCIHLSAAVTHCIPLSRQHCASARSVIAGLKSVEEPRHHSFPRCSQSHHKFLMATDPILLDAIEIINPLTSHLVTLCRPHSTYIVLVTNNWSFLSIWFALSLEPTSLLFHFVNLIRVSLTVLFLLLSHHVAMFILYSSHL